MAFTSAVLEESKKLGSGEVLRTRPFNVEAFSTFEDGLIMGRFAKFDTGSVDNLDNSATPKIAGIVTRLIGGETGVNTYRNTGTLVDTVAEVVTTGFATVDVVTGATPVRYGIAYAVNTDTTVSNATKASVKITGIDTGASTVDAFTITVNGVAVNTASLDFSSVTNGTQLATVLGGISGLDVAYTSTDNGTLTVTASTAGAKVFTAVTLTASNVAVGIVGTPINGTDAVINGEDLGKASTVATDNVDSGYVFWEQVDTNVWLVAKASLV